MDKRQLKIIFLTVFIITFALVAYALVFSSSKKAQLQQQSQPQVIAQTFAEVKPSPKTTTILAPNGKMDLVVKEEKSGDSMIDTFSVSDASGGPQTQIYSETLPQGTAITIPYNTFSPDNKYIFLKRTNSSGFVYFALRTDGKPIIGSEQTVDFVSLFREKYSAQYSVTDVTGWGGMTLIVLNVNKADGSLGPSFWYDVTSNSFIPLATRFN